MAVQHVFRMAFYFILYAICALPVNSFAEDSEYYSNWEYQHSGKYKLVWYYRTKKDFNANQPNWVRVNDKELELRPGVRPPTINSVYLLEYSRVNENEEVLDIGTGTGLHAIYAAEKAKHIVATDIYVPAVEAAKVNAKRLGVGDKIDFRAGDLFKPVHEGEKFDVIFFNINFPFSVGDDDRRRLHERFFAEVRNYMKPNARIYYQTSFIKNLPYILDMLNRNGFRIMEMHSEYLLPSKHEPLFMMIQNN